MVSANVAISVITSFPSRQDSGATSANMALNVSFLTRVYVRSADHKWAIRLMMVSRNRSSRSSKECHVTGVRDKRLQISPATVFRELRMP